MFLGDKGKPSTFNNVRRNYQIIIDNEKNTIKKMTNTLGFYSIVNVGKINDIEVVYDTDKKLLTGAGLILRKKITPQRTYFTLIRISGMTNLKNREKKSFLGECEVNDQPSDFPVQIADGINTIFNNLFTVNVVDIVQHCTPYIKTEISGNRYKIISGTGYEAEMTFENLKITDFRTGRKVRTRNFTIEMDDDPNYEREREQILDCIDRHCKELLFVNRNRFEVAEVAVRIPEPKIDKEGKVVKEKKKSKKELKAELKNQE